MRKYLLLILIALFTIAVLLFLFNPQLLSDIWLWVVGLIGPIVALVKNGANTLGNLLKKLEDKKVNDIITSATDAGDKTIPKEPSLKDNQKIKELESEIERLQAEIKNQNSEDMFEGKTITVLRFFDDGETTLGLMFWEDKFFCYTLEDTFREVKVAEETRIPFGTYNLDFIKVLTPLTKKYRERYAWFNYHVEIKNVKNFTGIYIHSGTNHLHTKGCLLIADGIYSSDAEKTIVNSRKTFEKFYKNFTELRDSEIEVRIKIFDESWFKTAKIKNRYT